VFTYVDLFAGCGGLSLGLGRAGGVELLAVEKSAGAARTYYSNLIHEGGDDASNAFERHLDLKIEDQASAGLVVAPVAAALAIFERLGLPETVDLVAGGPPCQGFSLAGRRRKDDERNKLVWEFLTFVERANPRFVIIENVVGMGRKFSTDDERSTFADVQTALATTGQTYVVNAILVNAMHYGAPQHRPRLMIVGVRSDIAETIGIERDDRLWESHFASEGAIDPPYAPPPTVRDIDVVTLEHALDALDATAPDDKAGAYALSMRDPTRWHLPMRKSKPLNHEMRTHRPDTVYRFQFAQALVSIGVSARAMGPISKEHLVREARKISLWFSETPEPHIQVGADNFRTASDFIDKLLELRNKKHSQRVLSWSAPAHTVVTIPDDYIHPDQPRTFSVRELARIQGFPDDFLFEGKATTGGTNRRSEVPQYTQVGNAVSPLVGFALGNLIDSLAELSRGDDDSHSFATVGKSTDRTPS
jgi:DNA (cytosine-5)-methyltransferase 1